MDEIQFLKREIELAKKRVFLLKRYLYSNPGLVPEKVAKIQENISHWESAIQYDTETIKSLQCRLN